MTELNYDLIPEEVKRKAVDACFDFFNKTDLKNLNMDIETAKEICVTGIQIRNTQPTRKPVDMQVLVNSGVLCEFSSGSGFKHPTMGFLDDMGHKLYQRAEFYEYRFCRPLYGHWHSAKNFDDAEELVARLEHAGFEVDVEYLIGKLDSFRITGLQGDYCMPWEV